MQAKQFYARLSASLRTDGAIASIKYGELCGTSKTKTVAAFNRIANSDGLRLAALDAMSRFINIAEQNSCHTVNLTIDDGILSDAKSTTVTIGKTVICISKKIGKSHDN